MTLQERYAAALLARGAREVLPSPTSQGADTFPDTTSLERSGSV